VTRRAHEVVLFWDASVVAQRSCGTVLALLLIVPLQQRLPFTLAALNWLRFTFRAVVARRTVD